MIDMGCFPWRHKTWPMCWRACISRCSCDFPGGVGFVRGVFFVRCVPEQRDPPTTGSGVAGRPLPVTRCRPPICCCCCCCCLLLLPGPARTVAAAVCSDHSVQYQPSAGEPSMRRPLSPLSHSRLRDGQIAPAPVTAALPCTRTDAHLRSFVAASETHGSRHLCPGHTPQVTSLH